MNRRIRIILLAISLLLVIGTLGWLTHVLLVQAEETGHSEPVSYTHLTLPTIA